MPTTISAFPITADKLSASTVVTSLLDATYLVALQSGANVIITKANFATQLSIQPHSTVLDTLAGTTPSIVGLNLLQVASPVGANYLKISNLGTPQFLTASDVLSDIAAQPRSTNLDEFSTINPSLPGLNILRLDAPTISGYVKVNAGIDSDAFIRTPAQVIADIGGIASSAIVTKEDLTPLDASHIPCTSAVAAYVSARIGAGIKTISDDTVASAATINLDATLPGQVTVTGTTPITAITLASGAERVLKFTGITTLTYSASLLTPGSTDRITASGDYAVVKGGAGGVVTVTRFQRASAAPNSQVADLDGGTIRRALLEFCNIQYTSAFSLTNSSTGHWLSIANGDAETLADAALGIVLNGGSKTLSLGGNLTTTGGNITLAASATTSASLPAGTHTLATEVGNYSTVAQTPAAATRTYIAGSAITIPSSKMKIGSKFSWKFNITKTAAGSAASTFDVCIGTLGTTGDSAVLSFTKPAGTAAADEGFVIIEAVVRGPLSASGVLVGEFVMYHNLAATGHATIPTVCVNTVSGVFDVTTAGLIAGVCVTSGAADALTLQQVSAQAFNI